MAKCECYHHSRLSSEAAATMVMPDTLAARVAYLRSKNMHQAAERAIATAQKRRAS